MDYEKLLRHIFPIAVQWPHSVCESKEFQSWRWWSREVQNPAKPACDLFLGVDSFLFPVGAIRKMKEAECTCLGVAVI